MNDRRSFLKNILGAAVTLPVVPSIAGMLLSKALTWRMPEYALIGPIQLGGPGAAGFIVWSINGKEVVSPMWTTI